MGDALSVSQGIISTSYSIAFFYIEIHFILIVTESNLYKWNYTFTHLISKVIIKFIKLLTLKYMLKKQRLVIYNLQTQRQMLLILILIILSFFLT